MWRIMKNFYRHSESHEVDEESFIEQNFLVQQTFNKINTRQERFLHHHFYYFNAKVSFLHKIIYYFN